MTPDDVFADGPTVPRVTHRDKLAEIERELALRKNFYPKQIAAGRMSEETAAKHLGLMEAVAADYRIRPWPQTRELVTTWRDAAQSLLVLGVPATQMHRDELLAVLALAVDALKRAGLLTQNPPKETPT